MAEPNAFGRLAKDRHGAGRTPFRYPGGKAFLADLLEDRIKGYEGRITAYAEPYAGGAGAAIELLARGSVQAIILNDFDRGMHAAWHSILYETERFVERLRSTTVDLTIWRQMRDIADSASEDADAFELGFATYFLNRTNHSGVIKGAGPVGGYAQKGKWKIDARWYPETMVRRIEWLGDRRDRISIHQRDGLDFLKMFDSDAAAKTFFFIDPPYVDAGRKLYLDAMSDMKHGDLAKYLTDAKSIPHWLVTYDDCELIRRAYGAAEIREIPVRYSLRRRRMESEVCITPRGSDAEAEIAN